MMMNILTNYAQQGFDVIDSAEETAIVEYIQEHQQECPIELYRGMMVEEDFEIEVGEIVEFENSCASFDEDMAKAKDFALRIRYGVLYILENPVGLPLYEHADTCWDEQEWLILDGEFEVTDVEKDGDLTIARIKKV